MKTDLLPACEQLIKRGELVFTVKDDSLNYLGIPAGAHIFIHQQRRAKKDDIVLAEYAAEGSAEGEGIVKRFSDIDKDAKINGVITGFIKRFK